MTPEQAMDRLNILFAHAWMVRTFLKHAEEAQEDEEMMEVHRLIFDTVRVVEGSYQRRDTHDYLRRVKGKLPKLKRMAEFFTREFRRVSDHTNYQMAALSFQGCVQQIEEVLHSLTPSAEHGAS